MCNFVSFFHFLVKISGDLLEGECTFQTSIVRVSNESWWAEFANRFVIFYNARGVSGATKVFARVRALVIDTSLVGWAPTILQAYGNTGFTLSTTHANGLMVQNATRFAFWTSLVVTWSLT